MNIGKNYMSYEDWNKNWSLNNNIIFQKLIQFGINYYRKIIYKIFSKYNVKGNSILELGCGTGSDTIWIIKSFNFSDATIVDFSDKALEKVRSNKGSLNIKPINKNILELALKEKYDLVHSGFVIEHFYGKDRENIIKKHAEFVKDNGFVFIQAPGKTPISWLYSKTINKLNGIEELLYTKGELKYLLNKVELEILEFKSILMGSVFFILAKKFQ